MDPHALFCLPDAVALAASLFLKPSDLKALTCVSTAARQSQFQSICDAQPASLVLPPTDTDQPLAERLLHGIHSRDPLRLSRFKSVVLATPWHVDLLVDTGLARQIHSVRIDALEGLTADLVTAISKKLTHVRTLDLSHSDIKLVAPLVSMTQLRHLNLSGTTAIDLFQLRFLKQLEELVLDGVRAPDLSFLPLLKELRVLKIHAFKESGGCCGECGESDPLLEVPTLRGLDKLHTLSLIHCSIYSIPDLLSVADNLQRFTAFGVVARYNNATDELVLAAVRERVPHVELNAAIDGKSVADVVMKLRADDLSMFLFGEGCDY